MPGTPSRRPRWPKSEELVTSVQSGEWIVLAVVRRNEKLVAMLSRRGELVRLESIRGHCQLALVALCRGHGCNHVVDDGANVDQLLVGGLSFGWWWCRHGSGGGGTQER
jgi:hypothetical protein